jgi:4-hydroxy-3-methylbut-2-en-1-yl diphosphate reductase
VSAFPQSGQAAGLLVMAPLRVEARALASSDPSSVVVRTGAGPARAAATAARLMAGPRPAAIAVAGVAGGLISGMNPGTLVVADRVLDQNGEIVATLASAPMLAAELQRRGLPAVLGTVISCDHVVRGAGARAELAALGAVAVDMESAALLRPDWGVPVAVVRAIADTPERELRSPATIAGGIKALSSLRSAIAVLSDWSAAVGDRQVVLAGPRSFCAGVDRAIRTVERALEMFGAPVYVRRQIVHNRHVVEELQSRGAIFVQELDQVPDGATVVLSAHGVSRAVRAEAADRPLTVIDATCPLVAKVHHEVRRFTQRGYQVVLIGHDGHDETEGTLGEAEGLTLIEDPEEVASLDVADPERLAYITQTTLSPDDVAGVVSELSKRFPAVVGPSSADICYATQNRQDAVRAIAGRCDLILVVGSGNSSNTARLVEVAERAGCRAVMIEDASAIRPEWLRHARTVGVTAGASAPPVLVEGVIEALRSLGRLEIEEETVRTESVNFPLPLEVR